MKTRLLVVLCSFLMAGQAQAAQTNQVDCSNLSGQLSQSASTISNIQNSQQNQQSMQNAINQLQQQYQQQDAVATQAETDRDAQIAIRDQAYADYQTAKAYYDSLTCPMDSNCAQASTDMNNAYTYYQQQDQLATQKINYANQQRSYANSLYSNLQNAQAQAQASQNQQNNQNAQQLLNQANSMGVDFSNICNSINSNMGSTTNSNSFSLNNYAQAANILTGAMPLFNQLASLNSQLSGLGNQLNSASTPQQYYQIMMQIQAVYNAMRGIFSNITNSMNQAASIVAINP